MSVSKIDLHKFNIACPFLCCIAVRCAEIYAIGIKTSQAQYACQCEKESPQRTIKRLTELMQ